MSNIDEKLLDALQLQNKLLEKLINLLEPPVELDDEDESAYIAFDPIEYNKQKERERLVQLGLNSNE